MDKLFVPQFDPINEITQETNKTLKQLFKDKINGSFLIKIKSNVINELRCQLLNYYNFIFNNIRMVTGTDETPEYDICRIIIGVHRHHSIFLNKEDIRSNEKSEQYQKQLVNETIEKIKLRRYASAFYRKKQLLAGDEFLYFPIPYELFVICMKSIELMHNNEDLLIPNYYDIVNTALSALTLLENNFLSNVYPLCRVMIELYIKTLILKKHPEALESYQEFIEFEIEQSCCSQKYPARLNILYTQRKHKLSKNKTDFLHYGWLDSIGNYNTKVKNKYSIYGVFDYLTNNNDNVLNDILHFYKMCHGYTHGSSIHVKYPLLQYFEISIMLYYVLRHTFIVICDKSSINVSGDEPDIIKILDRDFNILRNQYNIKSTENFDSYYGLDSKK